MRTSSKASRAAYKRLPETCQKVRAEISEALEKVLVSNFGDEYSCKFLAELTDAAFDAALAHGTEPLRNALIDCEDELIDAGEALATSEDDARYECSRADSLESEVSELETQVRNLESQLDNTLLEVQSSRP